jgi:hypothetical protein
MHHLEGKPRAVPATFVEASKALLAAIGATHRVSEYVAKSLPLSFRRQMAP